MATAHPPPVTRPTGWIILRLTGLVLSLLVLGHFALTHIVHDVAETDAAYVVERLGNALFVAWDALMLWTAILHGATGIWIIVGESGAHRVTMWRRLLVVASVVLATAGSLVLVVA
jgi:succinate dehydrogenase / fumarate reductase membrane anchor subunit